MGILRNIVEAMQEADRQREEMDDNKTTDRYLRSLRRHRRVQMEEVEKQELIKKIKEFEQNRANILSKANVPDIDMIKRKIELKKNILQQKQFMIPKRKPKDSMLSKGVL